MPQRQDLYLGERHAKRKAENRLRLRNGDKAFNIGLASQISALFLEPPAKVSKATFRSRQG